MKWRLVLSVTLGDRTAEVHQIECEDNQCRIGRAKGHLRLVDPCCSREHAEIILDEAGVCRLRDLGSRNGTFVNGVRFTETDLRDGDEIAIGDTVLSVLRRCLVETPETDGRDMVRHWPELAWCRPSSPDNTEE